MFLKNINKNNILAYIFLIENFLTNIFKKSYIYKIYIKMLSGLHQKYISYPKAKIRTNLYIYIYILNNVDI